MQLQLQEYKNKSGFKNFIVRHSVGTKKSSNGSKILKFLISLCIHVLNKTQDHEKPMSREIPNSRLEGRPFRRFTCGFQWIECLVMSAGQTFLDIYRANR